MRVGIDYRPALLAKTGIGRSVEGLVRGLVETGRGEDLRLWGVFRRAGRVGERPAGARLLSRPLPGRLADGLGRIGLTPDRSVGGCDVWHHTDFVVPRTRCGAVATLHDVVFLRDEAWHGARRTRNLRRVLERIRARCRLVVVPSRAAARDAERLAALPADRLRVVPPGVDADWLRAAEPARRARPYVLAVGSLEPRKNLPRLFEAFAGVAADESDLELIVVGPAHQEVEAIEAARARCGASVLLAGRVDDATLARLYRGARAVAYVSLLEGFGLPVLEGMAAGVPVVTSRGTAMEETTGTAAVLVDPSDVASIEEGLRTALGDGALRARLAEAGPARAALYPWTRTAREAWKVYEEAIGP